MGQIFRQNSLQVIFELCVQAEPIKNIIIYANFLSGGHTSFHIGKFPKGGRLLIWIINWAQEAKIFKQQLLVI